MPRLSRRGRQIPSIVVEFLQRLLWNRFESATARRLVPNGDDGEARKDAAEHAASRSPTEHAAQSAGEEVTQAAAGPCPAATWHAAWLAAKQSAKDIVQPTARSAGTRCAAGRHSLARSARICSLTA